jgi:hypothetical protein
VVIAVLVQSVVAHVLRTVVIVLFATQRQMVLVSIAANPIHNQ